MSAKDISQALLEEQTVTEFLISVARAYVNPGLGLPELPANGADPTAILNCADAHGMVPLLHRTLSSLPSELANPELGALVTAVARSRAIQRLLGEAECQRCLESLNQHGIEPIVLKGLATAEALYDDPTLRSFGDLDLLITMDEWPDVAEALRDAGVELGESQGELPLRLDDEEMYDHWLGFRSQNGFRVECAFDPLELGLPPRSLSAFFGKAVPLSLLGARVRRLSREHELVQLCVHLNRHGFTRLIWWVDIALLLTKYDSTIRWDEVARLCRLEKVEAPVCFTLRRVCAMFDLEGPTEALAAMRPSWLRRGLWLRVWPESNPPISSTGVHEGPLVFRRSRGGLSLGQLASLNAQNALLMGRGPEKLRILLRKLVPPKRFLAEKLGRSDASYAELWVRRLWARKDRIRTADSSADGAAPRHG